MVYQSRPGVKIAQTRFRVEHNERIALAVPLIDKDYLIEIGENDMATRQVSDSGVSTPKVQVNAQVNSAHRAILTEDALTFLGRLTGEFESRRQELLQRRRARQQEIDSSKLPDFPS
jgi:malate synthase-like protein